MPRHRRATPPVLPASLAVGLLGAAALGGAVAPATPAGAARTEAAASPIPDATLPAPVAVRTREVITDVGL